MRLDRILGRALVSGTVASLGSVGALLVASRVEAGSYPQALNATSHWLHGDRAARVRGFDLGHTGTGYATHLAATLFWASFYEAWAAARPTNRLAERTARATIVAASAALVDYTATPHRFTPGWELVLSKRAMATVYAAMAIGFVLAPPAAWRKLSRTRFD